MAVRLMFPGTLIVLLVLTSRRALLARLANLRQKFIDAEYVVEEKVENYEPEQESAGISGTSDTATPFVLRAKEVVDVDLLAGVDEEVGGTEGDESSDDSLDEEGVDVGNITVDSVDSLG